MWRAATKEVLGSDAATGFDRVRWTDDPSAQAPQSAEHAHITHQLHGTDLDGGSPFPDLSEPLAYLQDLMGVLKTRGSGA